MTMFAFSPPSKMAGDPAGLMQIASRTPKIEQKPSFFGHGGAGRHIAGSLGDALMQMNGMRPVYAPALQDQRDLTMRQRLLEQQRDLAWEGFKREHQYKIDNPMPRAPHYFESNDGDIYAVGDDGAPKRLFDDPTPKVEHIIAGDGMGGQRIVPIVNGVPQLGGPIGNPNIPAPGTIIDDPRKGGAGQGAPRPF